MFEVIKALEIKNSMVFNLVFASNSILSCLFLFSLILLFLIPAVIAQIFIVAVEMPCLQEY